MKKVCCFWIVIMVFVFGNGSALATQGATRDECIQKSRAAAKMIKEQGLKAVLEKINDKKGPFAWKNSYVFCLSKQTGAMLGHPYFPKRMLGMHINEVSDSNGKKYMREILKTARTRGEGWVDYAFRLKNKNTFVMHVPGSNVIVGAGYYDGKTFPAPHYKASESPVPRLDGKRAAVIVAFKGFEDNEFNVPVALFQRAGVESTVFSFKKGLAKGMYGKAIDVAYQLEDLKVEDFDAVVFIGGSGSIALHNNLQAQTIARQAAAQGKVVSAICWAPVILANAGILKDKKVTVNPFEAEPFNRQGLKYTGKEVSVDGNIITANGPAASEAFGRAILAALE